MQPVTALLKGSLECRWNNESHERKHTCIFLLLVCPICSIEPTAALPEEIIHCRYLLTSDRTHTCTHTHTQASVPHSAHNCTHTPILTLSVTPHSTSHPSPPTPLGAHAYRCTKTHTHTHSLTTRMLTPLVLVFRVFSTV